MSDLRAVLRAWLRQPLVPAVLVAYAVTRVLLPRSGGFLLGALALPFLVVVRPVLHRWYAAGGRLSPRAAYEWSQSHGYGALVYYFAAGAFVVAVTLTDPDDPIRTAVAVAASELVLAYPWAALALRDGTVSGSFRTGIATLLRSPVRHRAYIVVAAAAYASGAFAETPAAVAGAVLLGLFGTGLVTAAFVRDVEPALEPAYG